MMTITAINATINNICYNDEDNSIVIIFLMYFQLYRTKELIDQANETNKRNIFRSRGNLCYHCVTVLFKPYKSDTITSLLIMS